MNGGFKVTSSLSLTNVVTTVTTVELTLEIRILLQRIPTGSYASLIGNLQSSGLGINLCANGFIEALVYDSVSDLEFR